MLKIHYFKMNIIQRLALTMSIGNISVVFQTGLDTSSQMYYKMFNPHTLIRFTKRTISAVVFWVHSDGNELFDNLSVHARVCPVNVRGIVGRSPLHSVRPCRFQFWCRSVTFPLGQGSRFVINTL